MRVKAFDRHGQLVGPVEVAPVVQRPRRGRGASPREMRIARGRGHRATVLRHSPRQPSRRRHACVCCRLPLFASAGKFDSGTGWPSFFRPVAEENVVTALDRSHGAWTVARSSVRAVTATGACFPDGPCAHLPAFLRQLRVAGLHRRGRPRQPRRCGRRNHSRFPVRPFLTGSPRQSARKMLSWKSCDPANGEQVRLVLDLRRDRSRRFVPRPSPTRSMARMLMNTGTPLPTGGHRLALDQSMLDLLPGAVYVCDPSGVITSCNRRAADLWVDTCAATTPSSATAARYAFIAPTAGRCRRVARRRPRCCAAGWRSTIRSCSSSGRTARGWTSW